MLSEMAAKFQAQLTSLRFFHWGTGSYAQHQALGSLYSYFSDWIDDVVETCSGVCGENIYEPECCEHERPSSIMSLLTDMKTFLVVDFPSCVNRSTDLLNKRDELLGQINKTLYLLRMI